MRGNGAAKNTARRHRFGWGRILMLDFCKTLLSTVGHGCKIFLTDGPANYIKYQKLRTNIWLRTKG